MQSYLKVLTLAAGLVGAMSIPAGADDHGNSPETATAVVVGSTTSGSHETSGDTDFFKFNAQAGRLYRIETFDLQPAGSSDTVLILYAYNSETKDLTILAEDDQSGSEPNASKIVWPCSSSSTFYLEIYQFYSTTYGVDYKFTIEDTGEIPPDKHGNYPAAAWPLVVDGTPEAGGIEISGDVDYFSFLADWKLFYDVETSDLSTEADTLLTLFAPDGETQMAKDDQSGRETNASRLVFQASEEAVFFVRVSHFLSTGTGDYSIQVRLEGPAKPIVTDGTPVAGLLTEAGDIDVFEFTTEAKHLYEVQLVTDNILNRFIAQVIDQDGVTRLAENAFSQSVLTWQAAATGTYFLLIREDVEGGNYDLSVLDLGSPPPDADLDDDGWVDWNDLYLFQSQWHTVLPTPTPDS